MKLSYRVLLLAALAPAGCDNGSGPLGNVQVSFATRSSAVATSGAMAISDALAAGFTIEDGVNTLVVTRAEIVLREVEFERLGGAGCNGTSDDGCEEVEFGPVLVDLPLTPGAAQRFAAELPPGTYVEVEFEIHKVTSGSDDADFRQRHPEFPAEASIRVQGTFNDQPFDFITDLNVEQELDLVPPLVVTDRTSSANVTIFVALDQWFRASDGTLLDPNTGNKGQVNENLMKNNIRDSIEAFEDPDGDGEPEG